MSEPENTAPTAVVLSNAVAAIQENGGEPVKVANVAVTDDGLGSNVLTLTGADASFFELRDGAGGLELWFIGNADAETQPAYDVAIEVDDAGVGSSPDASANFALEIGDVDEFDVSAPQDVDGGTGGAIQENATGAVGITASAVDADATNNGIIYSLTDEYFNPGGLAVGNFSIDPVTGVVSVTTAIDREAIGPSGNVGVTVRATSSDGSDSYQTFTVAVGNVDEGGEIVGAVPVGPDFLVETRTSGLQSLPAITALPSGGYVVTWTDSSLQGGDASGTGVKAQIFDASGAKVGGELLVNTSTTGTQTTSAVAALEDGRFVVSWQDNSGTGGDASSNAIKAQIFDADGIRVGGELLVNTNTANSQSDPTITGLADGGFVISWVDQSLQGGDSSYYSIKAQIHDAEGAKVGSEFLVNTQTLNYQNMPTVTALESGGFAIAWTDGSGLGGDSSDFGIKVQLFDSAGAKLGGEILANSVTADRQSYPSIASLDSGGFVVTWISATGTGYDIKAQLFDGNGGKVGGEFLVNTDTTVMQMEPSISRLASGGFVITWRNEDQIGGDGSGTSISAQIFDESGNKVGAEFTVNSSAVGSQFEPVVAGLPSGDLVVAWKDAWSIRARMFDPEEPAAANDDNLLTTEDAAISGSVFADNGAGADSDPEGDAFEVVAVDGSALAVGEQVTLASGALLTLRADGTFDYDPNGAFDALTDGSSGAANTSALDSFSYTLSGGNGATVTVTVNGVASADDRLEDGGGDDEIVGTEGNDRIMVRAGGSDLVDAGTGRDVIYYGAALDGSDRNNGGDAGGDPRGDLLVLQGNYTITLGEETLVDVEKLRVLKAVNTSFGYEGGGTFSYDITTVDANVAAGGRLVIQGGSLQPGETLRFDGSAELDGSFQIFGGRDDDILIGGAGNDHILGRAGEDSLTGNGGNDRLRGGLGGDRLDGGEGADVFVYAPLPNAPDNAYAVAALESTGLDYDTIVGFDFAADRIDLPQAVTGLAEVLEGSLSNASFDADLAAAVDGALDPSAAVLFTADAGDHSGETFLIVDADGDGAYQANLDFVILLDTPLGTPTGPDFLV